MSKNNEVGTIPIRTPILNRMKSAVMEIYMDLSEEEMKDLQADMIMGMNDVIEFFLEVSQILDDNDVETDKEFPERYTRAMNRLRYEGDKSNGSVTKKVKSKNSRGCIVKCGNCGSECIDGNPHYHYCPNCGFAVKGY